MAYDDVGVVIEEPEVYRGQELVCKKFGHPLKVIYADAYQAMLIEIKRKDEEIERLKEKISKCDLCRYNENPW